MAQDAADALGFIAEYAKSGRSTCKQCKTAIADGELRIGKLVPNPYKAGSEMPLWYHRDCMFDNLRKGRAGKVRIYCEEDLKGFEGERSLGHHCCTLAILMHQHYDTLSLWICRPQESGQEGLR